MSARARRLLFGGVHALSGLGVLLALCMPVWAQNATLELSQAALNRLVGRLGALSNSGVYQQLVPLQGPGFASDCRPFGVLSCPGLRTGQTAGHTEVVPLLVCTGSNAQPMLLPGEPSVTWQWWVTDAKFTLAQGSMTFTATVRSRVGNEANTDTRTVPASVTFVPAPATVALASQPGPGFSNSSESELPNLELPNDMVRVNIGAFVVPLQSTAGATMTQVDVAKLYGIAIPIRRQRIRVPLPDGGTRTITAKAANITPQYLAGKIVIAVDVGF